MQLTRKKVIALEFFGSFVCGLVVLLCSWVFNYVNYKSNQKFCNLVEADGCSLPESYFKQNSDYKCDDNPRDKTLCTIPQLIEWEKEGSKESVKIMLFAFLVGAVVGGIMTAIILYIKHNRDKQILQDTERQPINRPVPVQTGNASIKPSAQSSAVLMSPSLAARRNNQQASYQAEATREIEIL